MDWLKTIDGNTTVLVPTRGLQHSLHQCYADQQLAAGCSVWETPKICVWDDLIDQLYQLNKSRLGEPKALISDAQSFLVWQQVIAKSKKSEDSLTLLNESQTASAAQRSWKLLNKWQVDEATVTQNHDEDSNMFWQWCEAYRQRLQQAAWIDNVQRERLVIDNLASINGLTNKVIFAYFDLQTSSQRTFIAVNKARGIQLENVAFDLQQQSVEQLVYQKETDEITSVLLAARHHLEANPQAKIGIVIPDLSQRRQEVEIQATQVFYPDRSPVEMQSEDSAYRFSLGYSLKTIPYISATLQLLDLLKPTFRYQEINYLLRCQWLPFARDNTQDVLQLLRELKQSRTVYWSWEKLLEKSEYLFCGNGEHHAMSKLFKDCILFREHWLNNNSEQSPAKQIKTTQEWQSIFNQWCAVFAWERNEIDSYHYQAQQSWLSVQETFISFDQVQLPIGLNRALQQIQTLCTDAVYLRQARNEPILISGVLEAIGQPADVLFVTGMNENYPTPLGGDAFISNQALAKQGYPFAEQSTEFDYEKQKLQSLLAGVPQLQISYAIESDEGELKSSALFRGAVFQKAIAQPQVSQQVELVTYRDSIGDSCQNSSMVTGGAKIFENQSHCPFRAYIVHRVLYENEQEPEFGLDDRDSGNIVHKLLELIWRDLGTSSTLIASTTNLSELVTKHVDLFIHGDDSAFQYDRRKLLLLERERLISLLEEWLSLERDQRIAGFNVIGKESKIKSEFAKIPIKLVIDRVDRLTESNKDLIIDYKTGNASPNDWLGERPRSPQLPLYAVALEEYRQQQNIDGEIRGIAFAQVKRSQTKLDGFAGVSDIAKGISDTKIGRENTKWDEKIVEWRENLANLAEEFLSGTATVDPLKGACRYCELSSVCRVNQLRQQSTGIKGDDV